MKPTSKAIFALAVTANMAISAHALNYHNPTAGRVKIYENHNHNDAKIPLVSSGGILDFLGGKEKMSRCGTPLPTPVSIASYCIVSYCICSSA